MSITKAKRQARITVDYQSTVIEDAIQKLTLARTSLRLCGCKKAADAVARAIKSADGALRHARLMAGRDNGKPFTSGAQS